MAPTSRHAPSSEGSIDPVDVAARLTGHTFADTQLVRRAFTHPSAVENRDPDAYYERLEFLGDSVLGLIVSEEIYLRFPDMPEGGMTRIKVSVVSGTALARVAADLGLADAIIFGDSERGTGGRGLARALENVYEALTGALFLDGGIEVARTWVLDTLGPLIAEQTAESPENPKSALQEIAQARGEAPIYRVISQEGPPHARTFTAIVEVGGKRLGRGSGHTKKEAEAAAAATALTSLKGRTRKRSLLAADSTAIRLPCATLTDAFAPAEPDFSAPVFPRGTVHLKSLILKGFKSFADKSTMALEPGVTVVVGPNGSGKSNISDAVLWVLGEQSAKTLRGQAMEDVIFAGSSARQAVGVAEVDLVLDNSDGALPLEFTEVTVTRRMYRNGESEYLINNTPTRLMDIQDLLHDSGLGRDTHSIISQGRLDEVLNSRAEERRSLIEEAAGVLKHKKRKERALRKLTGMDAHLERARDISSEIDRQLRPLQRQATKAQEHASLVTNLRDMELALAVDDLRRLQTEWDDLEKLEKEADVDIDLSRYRLAEKERELNKFQAMLEEKGLFVGDLSEQRRRMQSILERLDAGLLLLEEKGKNLIGKLSELRQKLHQSETRSLQRDGELERLVAERTETNARLKAFYVQLGELRKESETVRKARTAADDELTRMTGEIRRARKQLEDDRIDASKAEQAMSAHKLEHELLAERAVQIREQHQAAQATLSARRSRLDSVAGQLSHARREMALADSDVDKRVRVLESRRRDLEGHRERLTDARAEARGLEEVDRAFASAAPALAWALAQERSLPGLVGPVAEVIHAPQHYETLVERLLGADLFGLLVEDSASAGTIAETLQNHSEGEISIIPLDGVRQRLVGTPKKGTRLLDSLTCDDRVRPAVEALLGDVFIVDDVHEALAAASSDKSGARFATPDGAVAWPSGKLTLGTQVSDTEGVLVRKRRINELRDEIVAFTAAVGEAEAAAGEAEEALAAAQQDALELTQKIATLAGEHDSLLEDVGLAGAAAHRAGCRG